MSKNEPKKFLLKRIKNYPGLNKPDPAIKAYTYGSRPRRFNLIEFQFSNKFKNESQKRYSKRKFFQINIKNIFK